MLCEKGLIAHAKRIDLCKAVQSMQTDLRQSNFCKSKTCLPQSVPIRNGKLFTKHRIIDWSKLKGLAAKI